MKKILKLIIIMPFIMSNACSQDVAYDENHGVVKIKQDVPATNSVIEDLNAEVESEAKTKEKTLIRESIMKKLPAELSAGMQWKKASQYESSFFGVWIDSWRSMNVEYYLSNYSKDFDNGESDYASWAEKKRQLHKAKEYIKVSATSINLLKHPEKDIMAATFYQDYRSNNFSDLSWKRQFWKKEDDGRWRIVYEAVIDGPYTPFLERFQ